MTLLSTFDSLPLLAPFSRCYWQLNNKKPFVPSFLSFLSDRALSLHEIEHFSLLYTPIASQTTYPFDLHFDLVQNHGDCSPAASMATTRRFSRRKTALTQNL